MLSLAFILMFFAVAAFAVARIARFVAAPLSATDLRLAAVDHEMGSV